MDLEEENVSVWASPSCATKPVVTYAAAAPQSPVASAAREDFLLIGGQPTTFWFWRPTGSKKPTEAGLFWEKFNECHSNVFRHLNLGLFMRGFSFRNSVPFDIVVI